MLQLSPQQMTLLAQVTRERIVRRLCSFFSMLWPAMPERLGDRYPAFIDLAVQHAERHGLAEGPCVARYVNLWFVWGAAFEDKPGFEWAKAILADTRRSEFVKPHQLVQRSNEELARLQASAGNRPAGTGLSPDAFTAADMRIIEELADLGRLGSGLPSKVWVPRLSCDLDTVDFVLPEQGARQVYVRTDRDWRRQALAAPIPPIRVDASHPAPAGLHVLTHASGEPDSARLQVRVHSHAVCDGDTHPRVAYTGQHGEWAWRGHEAKAVSWLVESEPLAPAQDGWLVGMAREPLMRLQSLSVSSCGLRNEGAPIGEIKVPVWTYPADQWLLEWRHAARPDLQWPDEAGHRDLGPAAMVRLERDGALQDAQLWQTGFTRLHQDLAAGMDRLLLAFERTCGVEQARLDVSQLALMAGQASLSWGFMEGPQGLADKPLMRLEGWLDMIVCALDLQLSGEIALAGSRARLRLRSHGQAALQTTLQRDGAEQPWPDALLPAQTRVVMPFELDMDPLAMPDLAASYPLQPVSGQLIAEGGLRVKPGAGGCHWFLHIRIEPVATTLLVHDPVLGLISQPRPVLPALTLLEWSLG